MGARRRERKLFWVEGECKSGLKSDKLGDGSGIPIDEFGGLVFGVA